MWTTHFLRPKAQETQGSHDSIPLHFTRATRSRGVGRGRLLRLMAFMYKGELMMANRFFKPKSLEEIFSTEAPNDGKPVEWRGRPGEPRPLWSILGNEPPIGWTLAQAEMAGRQPGAVPIQLAQALGIDEVGNPSDAVLVPLDVPGFGQTYFDPAIVPNVMDFIHRTRQAGMDIQFESGFRSTGKQKTLHSGPTATTPARPGNSLHEAGRAFDISLEKEKDIPRYSGEQFRRIIDLGRQAGFNWGGNFRKPDPGHFFIEVPEGIGNRSPRIQRAQEYFRNGLESQ